MKSHGKTHKPSMLEFMGLAGNFSHLNLKDPFHVKKRGSTYQTEAGSPIHHGRRRTLNNDLFSQPSDCSEVGRSDPGFNICAPGQGASRRYHLFGHGLHSSSEQWHAELGDPQHAPAAGLCHGVGILPWLLLGCTFLRLLFILLESFEPTQVGSWAFCPTTHSCLRREWAPTLSSPSACAWAWA